MLPASPFSAPEGVSRHRIIDIFARHAFSHTGEWRLYEFMHAKTQVTGPGMRAGDENDFEA